MLARVWAAFRSLFRLEREARDEAEIPLLGGDTIDLTGDGDGPAVYDFEAEGDPSPAPRRRSRRAKAKLDPDPDVEPEQLAAVLEQSTV